MSMWAQVQHVEDAWPRPFAPGEIAAVQHAVDRAEREVARHVDVAARIALGTTTTLDVRDAVVAMVVRMMHNRAGIRSQTAGPFSQVIDQSVASGRLEITRAERRMLGMIEGAGSVAVEDAALARPVRHVVSTSGLIPEGVWP